MDLLVAVVVDDVEMVDDWNRSRNDKFQWDFILTLDVQVRVLFVEILLLVVVYPD
jgi:hypothetical protein